ncbi:MAG: hypothetical protein WCK07_03765 [Betaproteobacteria bacterium]
MNEKLSHHIRRGALVWLPFAVAAVIAGCNGKGAPPEFPPPDVNVIKVTT